MNYKNKPHIAVILVIGLVLPALADKPTCSTADLQSSQSETKDQRDRRMEWWRQARFGMFIHWGLYAVPAGEWKGKETPGIGEWIMNSAQIPVAEYELLARQFNPIKFDAEQWVKIAKDAGMKYIVITSKHHDGFCLWDSKVSDYDIMDATPFKRDILGELAQACRKHGIKLCFYHSIMDWHHPDAQGPHYPNYNTDKKTNPNFARYVENYMKPQLAELVTSYGPLGVLWFDGDWIPEWNEQFGTETYYYVRALQPDIIINNRVGTGRKGMGGMTEEGSFGGDFGTPEQEIPATGLPGVDWETCMTMNDTWGFKKNDLNWKSTKQLLHNLVDIVSKGGNYLLNVGPTAEGLIPQPSIERLEAMGKWLKVNGQSICGTSASPFKKLEWGRCTQKQLAGNKTRLYLHVFDWPKNGKLNAGALENKVIKAFALAKGEQSSLAVTRRGNEIVIDVPAEAPDPIISVVALDIQGKPSVIEAPEIVADTDIFVDTMEVIINSDVQNHQIRYTLDGTEPQPESPAYQEPIHLKESATVTAALFRDGKAITSATERTFKKVIPRPADKIEGLVQGLYYEYYQGNWDKLPDFDSLAPKATGTADTFGISQRQQDDNFGFRFRGYLQIPRTGVYTFILESDDGSKLYIGRQCVVENDGLHATIEKSGMIALETGLHPITVVCFEKTGGQNLEVYRLGPQLEEPDIPASELFHIPKN
ncbi:MAG: alpha-L-fucosidase [Planctomycetota bacterium]|jgi:alpha-L-fucosidase